MAHTPLQVSPPSGILTVPSAVCRVLASQALDSGYLEGRPRLPFTLHPGGESHQWVFLQPQAEIPFSPLISLHRLSRVMGKQLLKVSSLETLHNCVKQLYSFVISLLHASTIFLTSS